MRIQKWYYRLKPLVPRPVQLAMRKRFIRVQRKKYREVWPIDERAAISPPAWSGWPEGKRFALVLTHDVETSRGIDRCLDLAAMERSLGFRSSFNFVPERYPVPEELRRRLAEKGFEIGVHGLYHDGKYFESRETFLARAREINRYLKDWNAVGFRTPSMLHNLEWIAALDIEYDASTFDTDPFEPQPDGVGTIFPFRVPANSLGKGYIELPYTIPQDFTLYILMEERTNDIWKKKVDWVAERGGMALMNVHPDYMRFPGRRAGSEEYPARLYEDFLEYTADRHGGDCWHALPRDVAAHARSALR